MVISVLYKKLWQKKKIHKQANEWSCSDKKPVYFHCYVVTPYSVVRWGHSLMFEREVKQQVEYVKGGRPFFANVTSRFPRECVNNGPVLCSLKVRERHYGAAPADSQQSNSATRESRLNRRTPVSRLHFSVPASIPVWVECSQRSAHTGRGGARCLLAAPVYKSIKMDGERHERVRNQTPQVMWAHARRSTCCETAKSSERWGTLRITSQTAARQR